MTIVLNGTSGAQIPLGTAAAPSATNTTAQATGLYFPSSTTLGLSTNGTAALTIDASQNVGIGTSSPAKKLHVNGDIRLGDGGGTGAIFTDATNGLRFMLPAAGTSNTESMRLDSSGNLGIGTSSPGSILDVQSATSIIRNTATTGTNQVAIRQGNTGGYFYTGIDTSAGGFLTGSAYAGFHWMSGAYPMIFATNNSERMRIDSSGNVGIGTSSPATKFNVNGNVSLGNTYAPPTPSSTLNQVLVNTSTVIGSHVTYTAGANTGGLLFNAYEFNNGSNYDMIANIIAMPETWTTNGNGSLLRFLTASSSSSSPTEAMRIDKNGNLLVGTTTASAKLTVVSSGDASFLQTTGSTATCGYAKVPGNTAYYWLWQNSSGSNIAFIRTTDGTTVTYNTGSDARLKENIADSGSSLSKINSIKVREFNWKSTGKKVDFGFIAQELNEVAPEAVSEGKDNEDGTIDVPWGVDNSILVPLLVKAIQELKAELDALKGTK